MTPLPPTWGFLAPEVKCEYNENDVKVKSETARLYRSAKESRKCESSARGGGGEPAIKYLYVKTQRKVVSIFRPSSPPPCLKLLDGFKTP